MKNKTNYINCPERIWFRILIYVQYIVILVLPIPSGFKITGTLLILLHTFFSPDLLANERGLEFKVFGLSKFVQWENIDKVYITPKQIFISIGWLIPVFAFYWRKNFASLQGYMSEAIPEKVIKIETTLPL